LKILALELSVIPKYPNIADRDQEFVDISLEFVDNAVDFVIEVESSISLLFKIFILQCKNFFDACWMSLMVDPVFD
jgi:hypothetical protein